MPAKDAEGQLGKQGGVSPVEAGTLDRPRQHHRQGRTFFRMLEEGMEKLKGRFTGVSDASILGRFFYFFDVWLTIRHKSSLKAF
jgi:hypothetical protein